MLAKLSLARVLMSGPFISDRVYQAFYAILDTEWSYPSGQSSQPARLWLPVLASTHQTTS